MSSADGRGRTLFEILSGRNQRDMRPLELQYHNPLDAKVGCTVSFDSEPGISGINFVIDEISVYETRIGNKRFFHTDYHLKGISLDHDVPIRMRLRLIKDENVFDQLGHRLQLLYLYDEMSYDESFHHDVLGNHKGELEVHHADDGTELEEPRMYWRVEDVVEPYKARQTLLRDLDGDGSIEDDELEHRSTTYWDYHRDTEDENQQSVREFLTIEMDDETGYFTFLRGTEILPSQVTVF